ncbi:type I secretion system permease/ATPase [Tabrizicola sp.]|uniref:type I secretion system permease/ATPase n=1 Tax=Tabrizicola sp. TaxID=2005166 RepID=UPI0025F7B2AD|nr:type I secretion system permease/ATPase [Tabrizicola sp.]MBY0349684.1 type I secretion system permease/ATPase [Tabrizicola sp.]MDK2773430.1 type I secretion system permease/ATPase [Tabrizicola sp.]
MADTATQIIDARAGRFELRAARAASRQAVFTAFLFSALVNVLMLTAPLYMLQVYDRVLVSRSEETLLALSLLMAFLFVIMGVLDHARGRITARVGARLQEALDARVLSAAFRRLTVAPQDTAALAAQKDLDAIARFWASPVLLALFDAPWAPVFIAAIFVFQPWLGALALAGGLVILVLSLANQHATDRPLQAANLAGLAAERQAENLKQEAELVQSLGMAAAAFARLKTRRDAALDAGLAAADSAGRYSVAIRTFRLFLQSAMLGLAAWLVLRQELSAGAMIAASILTGRALQPVEQAVGQWAVLSRARQAGTRLAGLLASVPPLPTRTDLPRPKALVEVQGLTVVPPGAAAPVLRNLSFTLPPGRALGVIGPSGSGKSSLARALSGVWHPAAGRIRLAGATLDQYDPDRLGSYIGYLPQRVTLFDGTIAENIARLHAGADAGRIVAAARAAAAHQMILKLPNGYDTQVATMGSRLSGGQIQRIGLARALYGDPVLLILDEPNSNLDNDGSIALNSAIRTAKARGASVLIMAHRPAAIQECDLLLVLQDGAAAAFGPRDTVLREAVRNAGDIARAAASGGVA